VDYFFIYWDRLAFIRYHRGFTHSLVALPLLALAGALLGRYLGGPRWFKPLFILGLVVLGSHLLLDLATSYGTQLFSPFSRRRLSLDWIFIIDPYFTALLVAGAIAALSLPLWGPRLGAWFLTAAAVYLLVCASYHHQALDLARRIFPDVKPGGETVAALPQPFSSRRWQLIAAGPADIQQAFVQLPFEAALGLGALEGKATVVPVTPNQACPTPASPYKAPGQLTIQTWNPARRPPPSIRPRLKPSWPASWSSPGFPCSAGQGPRAANSFWSGGICAFPSPAGTFPLSCNCAWTPKAGSSTGSSDGGADASGQWSVVSCQWFFVFLILKLDLEIR